MKKKFPLALIIMSVLMLACELMCAFVVGRYSISEFFILSVTAFILCLFFIGVLVLDFKHFYKCFGFMSKKLEMAGAEFMSSLPAPSVVIDKEGFIIWYNEFFKEKVSAEREIFGCPVRAYVNIDVEVLRRGTESICTINGSIYRVKPVVSSDGEDDDIMVLYFADVTEFLELEKKFNDTRQSVLILVIDNYDDIMQNAKETEKARTSVETEQILENFMNGTDGVIKKISDNTFIAILEDKHLNKIIEEKFKILDVAREIKVGDRNSLTFSIGVGQGAGSLSESERIARQCLDMALGRGGDQAVVKTENGYRFFGGVSKGVEKKSRAKTRIIANTLQDFVEKSGTVFIMGHSFGDLDSIGSATGMAGAVRLLGKDAFVVVDRKKNLALQLIDYIENQVEDELYITPQLAVDSITDNDLLIIVDTHNKDFIESRELYKKAKKVVVIDHHRKTVNFIDDAVIFHHEPYASSASEMVTEIIQYFKLDNCPPLKSCFADALMSGIALDTKNFVMRTGVRTFEAAAYLRKLGADTVSVKSMFANSIESYKRKTQIVASADIHNRCAIATTDVKSDDVRLISPQAADELLGISGVDASFVAYKTGDIINISARSLGALNVQVIMEQLGGGGHQTMAASQLKGISMNEAVEKLKKAIDEYQKE